MTDDDLARMFDRSVELEASPDAQFVADLRDEMTAVATGADSSFVREPTEETFMLEISTSTDEGAPPRRRGRALGYAAVVLGAVIGVVAVGFVATRGDDDLGPVADLDDLTAAHAVAAAEFYIESFNAGDEVGVLSLFTHNTFIEDNFSIGISRVDWERMLAWDAAQGTDFVDAECRVVDSRELSIEVRCSGLTRNAVAQAIGVGAVPTQIVMVFTRQGIGELKFVYGTPDFTVTRIAFQQWMEDNNPAEAGFVDFRDWTSVDDATAGGEARARYASEWAGFLTDSGCVARQGGSVVIIDCG